MLLPKPPACSTCPLFQNGAGGFCPDKVAPGAPVEVWGQNPGRNEVEGLRLVEWDRGRHEKWEPHPPEPYLGKTGYMMERDFFPLAGLNREKVTLRNPIRCRWQGTDKLPPVDSVLMQRALEHCQHHHGPKLEYLRAHVRLIVAEGEYALYAATAENGADSPGHKISRGIGGWRGWALPFNPPPFPRVQPVGVYDPRPGDTVVLPTYHLAYLFRNPWERPASQADWSKVGRFLKGAWPEPFPQWEESPPLTWPQVSGFDTEFYEREDTTTHLIRWSLAYRVQGRPRLWVVEAGNWDPPQVPARPRVYFWNVEADIHHLLDILQVPAGRVQEEDAMYMHAVLWPDLDHDLDFAGSIYARTNRWKHLFLANPRQYAGGDALGTYDVAMPLDGEFTRDPRSKWVYETLTRPLIPIIREARRRGIRVSPGRVQAALGELDALQQALGEQAQAVAGFPINLGSDDQVRHYLYEVEKAHLNPLTGRPRLRGWRG